MSRTYRDRSKIELLSYPRRGEEHEEFAKGRRDAAIPLGIVSLWAVLPGSATASTAADVCATLGNVCAAGTATINVPTVVTCPSTLDFETAGFGDVVVNAGGDLRTNGGSRAS